MRCGVLNEPSHQSLLSSLQLLALPSLRIVTLLSLIHDTSLPFVLAMDKHNNYSAAAAAMVPSLSELDYSTMIPAAAGGGMVDYMVNEVPPMDPFGSGSSHMMDRSFSAFTDVLQFADFGPKLALHHHSNEAGNPSHGALADPVYMLKFPVLNGEDDGDQGANDQQPHQDDIDSNEFLGASGSLDRMAVMNTAGTSSNPIGTNNNNNNNKSNKNNGKRKRARALKTTEEAESQRMTHIAVERNRRKQMNEHLRVLRTLMPSSYVQRGDQASIVGGAIEFVRELEELLQCLESQKRRKLYGEAPALPLPNSQPFDPANDQIITINEEDDNTADVGGLMMVAHNAGPAAVALAGLQEEAAESKTDIADVEVKLLGFDAFIKILSRRRPGQLIKAISGLQALHFTILHTNITTIEQTVLYSFNIKISSETRFTAEDIATSVQHIFTFIHSNQDM